MWLLCVTGLIGFFNNCQGDSQYQLFRGSSGCAVTDTSCVGKNNATNLDLRVHGDSSILVAAAVNPGVTVSGDCNEGGFVNNKVVWRLYSTNPGTGQTQLVSDSNDLGLNSKCQNGRFELRVSLVSLSKLTPTGPYAALTNPPNASAAAARTPYTLEVEVVGIDDAGVEQKNSNVARKKLSLNPGA